MHLVLCIKYKKDTNLDLFVYIFQVFVKSHKVFTFANWTVQIAIMTGSKKRKTKKTPKPSSIKNTRTIEQVSAHLWTMFCHTMKRTYIPQV